MVNAECRSTSGSIGSHDSAIRCFLSEIYPCALDCRHRWSQHRCGKRSIREQILRDPLHVGVCHALDPAKRLVETEVAIEVDLLASEMRHPARGVLEAQHQTALEVILRTSQLGVGNWRTLHPAQLLDTEIDHL